MRASHGKAQRDTDVNPTDYVPSDKEAPSPATPAPGIDSATAAPVETRDVEPEIAEKVRKPRTRQAVEAVRQATDTVVRAASRLQQTVDVKRMSEGQRARAVDDAHKRRSRAARRYGSTVKDVMLRPAVRMALRSQGINGAPAELVDTIVNEVCREKRFAGFKTSKKGTVEHHKLTLDRLIAYTIGSHAIGVEDWIVDASVNHPTMFDVLVFIMAMGTMVETLATSSVIASAIEAHVKPVETPSQPTTDSVNDGTVENAN